MEPVGRRSREGQGVRPSGLLDWTFEIALILKCLDGVLEVNGGLLLLFISTARFDSWVVALTQHERSQDPNDFIANQLLTASRHLSDGG